MISSNHNGTDVDASNLLSQTQAGQRLDDLKWMIIVQLNYGCQNMEMLAVLRQFIGCGRLKDLLWLGCC